MQGPKSLALGRQRRNKDPALARFRPLRCRPFSIASTLIGQQPETLRYFAEGRQHTNSLRSSSTVDIVRHLRRGNAPIDLGWVSLSCALVSEFLFGLGLGLTTRLVLCALQAGGGLIDNDLSLSAAQQLAPTSGISGGVMGRILMFVGLAIFWTSDYLSALIIGIRQSFRVLPLGTATVTQASLDLFVRLAGEVFAAGLIIAAPIALLCFIVTMGLGFLSRSVHGLNIFGESFSIRVTVGGAGIVLFLPLLLDLARFGMERMLPAAADYFKAMS